MKDLMSYFNTIFIAFFKTNYMYGSMPMKSKKKNSIYFACEVPTDGDYYVAVH